MNALPLKLHWNFAHGLPLPCLLLLIILFTQSPPPATAQLPNTLPPSPPDKISKLRFDKSMAIVLVILVVVFFILGFLSVYTRQCTERRIRGRFDLTIPIVGSHRRQRGLDSEIIETFPTFVYSTVKGLKIGRATLECAVCLNEFQDDEALRLIPKCNHVFHAECIDAWLANHSTCPVCRANLIPRPGDTDTSSHPIQISDPLGPDSDTPPRPDIHIQVIPDDNNRNGLATAADTSPSPKVNYLVTPNRSVTPNRPLRSRSPGFRIASWFPRSHSTGHSLVQPGESYERFTLRLPEEVRNQLVSSTWSRTTSSGVAFTREGSGRMGYRARSVGSSAPARGYEWLNRRGFSWTPPFLSRAGSTRSPKGSADPNKSPVTMVDVGERSSDRLFAGN